MLSNKTTFLVFSHFYANGNVEYNSFYQIYPYGLTLHETLIEKIYSGNKKVIIQIITISACLVTIFSKFNDFSAKEEEKSNFEPLLRVWGAYIVLNAITKSGSSG